MEEKYKRKGYGTIVLKAISNILALMGMDVCATVTVENEASIKMFENTGFKCIDHCYWTRTYPIGEFHF